MLPAAAKQQQQAELASASATAEKLDTRGLGGEPGLASSFDNLDSFLENGGLTQLENDAPSSLSISSVNNYPTDPPTPTSRYRGHFAEALEQDLGVTKRRPIIVESQSGSRSEGKGARISAAPDSPTSSSSSVSSPWLPTKNKVKTAKHKKTGQDPVPPAQHSSTSSPRRKNMHEWLNTGENWLDDFQDDWPTHYRG